MRGIEEMIQFQCDYEEGACPQILERLVETNLEQTVGYSEDEYCKQAREKIKKACDAPEADVHFLVGGTQTNYVVIRSILRPYQGVISAVTGHINVHETGAVEATGHKVLALPSKDGKITASQVRAYYDAHWNASNEDNLPPVPGLGHHFRRTVHPEGKRRQKGGVRRTGRIVPGDPKGFPGETGGSRAAGSGQLCSEGYAPYRLTKGG